MKNKSRSRSLSRTPSTSSRRTRSLSVSRTAISSKGSSGALHDDKLKVKKLARSRSLKRSYSLTSQSKASQQRNLGVSLSRKENKKDDFPKSVSIRSRSRSRQRSKSRDRPKSRSRSRSKERRALRNILPPDLKLYKRNLATAFVAKNKQTNLWITSIDSQNDGQKQSYSFLSEDDAKECAYANSPPKLVPFSETSACFLCDEPFHSLRRRAMHCKNCGVCICKSCSNSWDKEMIPESFNIKKSSKVVVCKTCDFLVNAFRGALLDGQYKTALKIFMTGNINLRCPFANVNPGMEIM